MGSTGNRYHSTWPVRKKPAPYGASEKGEKRQGDVLQNLGTSAYFPTPEEQGLADHRTRGEKKKRGGPLAVLRLSRPFAIGKALFHGEKKTTSATLRWKKREKGGVEKTSEFHGKLGHANAARVITSRGKHRSPA